MAQQSSSESVKPLKWIKDNDGKWGLLLRLIFQPKNKWLPKQTSKVYSANPIYSQMFHQNTLRSRFPFLIFFCDVICRQLGSTSVPTEIFVGCFNGIGIWFQKCAIPIVPASHLSPLPRVWLKDTSWHVREIIYCWFGWFFFLKTPLRLVLV